MKYITIKLPLEEYEAVRSQLSNVIIKEVSIVDDFFQGDVIYHALRKTSKKAYKEWKEYAFNKRNP
jgi:hypothetical protein